MVAPGALVTPDRHQLGDSPSGSAELDRDHARIAHDLASPLADLLGGARNVGDLDGEVMDAGPFAGGPGFPRPRAGVVLHHREVDVAVAHVAREMVAGLARFRIEEPEDVVVEVPGPLHVVDFESDMDYSVH